MGGKMQVYSKAKQIELKRMWFNKFKESEKRVKELENKLNNVSAEVVNCFGLTPVSCDNSLIVNSDSYNKLVNALNK